MIASPRVLVALCEICAAVHEAYEAALVERDLELALRYQKLNSNVSRAMIDFARDTEETAP